MVVHAPELPISLTQAVTRLTRLAGIVEQIAVQVDAQPLPVCRFKRAKRCKARGATLSSGSWGRVYRFNLHAWTKLNSQIALYSGRPAHLHDLTVGHGLNAHWTLYGAPRLIGDKADLDGSHLTPPKNKAKTSDPCRGDEDGTARNSIETTFSSLVRTGLRIAPVRSWPGLRLRVALAVLAHNPAFFKS